MPCIGLCNCSWRITSLYLDCWGVCGCLVCIWSNNMFVRVPETTLSSWPMLFFWYLQTLVVNIQYKFLCINSNALSFMMSSLFSQNFSVKRFCTTLDLLCSILPGQCSLDPYIRHQLKSCSIDPHPSANTAGCLSDCSSISSILCHHIPSRNYKTCFDLVNLFSM